jgi:hypothetical protein
MYSTRSEVLTLALLKIQVFWDLTLCCWQSSSQWMPYNPLKHGYSSTDIPLHPSKLVSSNVQYFWKQLHLCTREQTTDHIIFLQSFGQTAVCLKVNGRSSHFDVCTFFFTYCFNSLLKPGLPSNTSYQWNTWYLTKSFLYTRARICLLVHDLRWILVQLHFGIRCDIVGQASMNISEDHNICLPELLWRWKQQGVPELWYLSTTETVYPSTHCHENFKFHYSHYISIFSHLITDDNYMTTTGTDHIFTTTLTHVTSTISRLQIYLPLFSTIMKSDRDL